MFDGICATLGGDKILTLLMSHKCLGSEGKLDYFLK